MAIIATLISKYAYTRNLTGTYALAVSTRNVTGTYALAEEATEIWGGHLETFEIFYCKN